MGEMSMKVVILAGGLGTRLSEETALKPKPMAEIGDRPILWHIMKIYSAYGFDEFVVCLGYKGYIIKEYFRNYFLHMSDATFDMRTNEMTVHSNMSEPWKVTLVDTGAETMTGGRLKRVAPYVGDETFLMTYGDGVADVMDLADDGSVRSFQEKPHGDGGWINGGFFVLEPAVFASIKGDATVFEQEPLEDLAGAGQLAAYKHQGFWQPMDTLRDKRLLEDQWASGQAPWKVW
jgi:glucose-1-phosphate cytidylyltransferase